jgi:hypothetical protein
MYPKLIPILQIEFDRPFRDEDIDFDRNPVLQVTSDGPKINADNVYGDCESEGAGINGASDLSVLSAQLQTAICSAGLEWGGYLDRT